MKLFAVTGNPVLHSKSPALHNAGFKACSVDAHYTRLASRSFAEALNTAKAIGISGLNVTAPFKEDAFEHVDSRCELSEKLCAVNTVLIDKDGKTHGHNTDPFGVTESLSNAGVTLEGKNVLVLGAGGAARAAVLGLIAQGALVTVSNRTVSKAQSIREDFEISQLPFDYGILSGALSDHTVIISTVGNISNFLDPSKLTPDHTILDATYAHTTWLSTCGTNAGSKVVPGTEWLLYQGALAFTLFCGNRAPVDEMRRALENIRPTSRIVLTGLMGSGKTTIAEELSEVSKLQSIDIDSRIISEQKKDIPAIFKELGEPHFRALEEAAVSTIPTNNEVIISTGGGAILSEKNRKALKENSAVVWLWATTETLAKRLGADSTRPLLEGDSATRLEKLLQERLEIYFQTADLIVSTETETAKESAQLIWDEYSKTRTH